MYIVSHSLPNLVLFVEAQSREAVWRAGMQMDNARLSLCLIL